MLLLADQLTCCFSSSILPRLVVTSSRPIKPRKCPKSPICYATWELLLRYVLFPSFRLTAINSFLFHRLWLRPLDQLLFPHAHGFFFLFSIGFSTWSRTAGEFYCRSSFVSSYFIKSNLKTKKVEYNSGRKWAGKRENWDVASIEKYLLGLLLENIERCQKQSLNPRNST